jgi:hypothetical protein
VSEAEWDRYRERQDPIAEDWLREVGFKWQQFERHPDVGRCEQITVAGAWQLVHTEASFGCVLHVERVTSSTP